MNDVAVLIPFGNGTPWRERALEYIKTWYAENLEGARILTGLSSSPWCKAEAVADALSGSTEEILVVADADSLSPGVRQAVQAVRVGAAWAMPHLKVYRMSREATEGIYSGASPGSLTGQNRWLDQDPYKGYEGGGITVLRREVYLNCPLDPAFRGWGQEDEAWAMALNGLYGPPWRGQGPLYHLWHEKPVRLNRYAGSDASLARLEEYREARTKGSWNVLLEGARRSAQGEGDPCKVAT